MISQEKDYPKVYISLHKAKFLFLSHLFSAKYIHY